MAALDKWLATLRDETYARGVVCFTEGRVRETHAHADHFVEARVDDPKPCDVTLFLTRGKWTSTCNCPLGRDCQHVVAAGLTWVANLGADSGRVLEPVISPERVAPVQLPAVVFDPPEVSVSKARAKKATFRDEWGPVIAAKLERPLTAPESRRLGQLADLFSDFLQSHHSIYEQALRRHGFVEVIPPGTYSWTPLFPGWWNYDDAPADPWALWQYLAYSLQLRGLPIPEVFQPLTDTSRVHASLDTLLAQQQLQAWRQALATPATPDPGATNTLYVDGITALRARIDAEGGVYIEGRTGPNKPWKPPTQKWTAALTRARPADFDGFSPAESALALTLAMANRYGFRGQLKRWLAPDVAEAVLSARAAHPAIILPDGRPFAVETEPLVPEAVVSSSQRGRLEVHLVTPDGASAAGARLLVQRPIPLYLHHGRVWRGPPPLPAMPLPTQALGDAQIMTQLRARGVRLPVALEAKVRHVPLRPQLKCWLAEPTQTFGRAGTQFHAQLFAYSDDPPCSQHWSGHGGWQWTRHGAPPAGRPDDPLLEFDFTAANAVGALFADFRFGWAEWVGAWSRHVTKNFPEEFLAWHATLPPGLEIDASPEVTAFFEPPLHASVDFSAIPSDSSHDWFDLTVALRVEDTTLSAEEIALLLKARGKWVRLPKGGWRRLELTGAEPDGPAAATLDRLGLTTSDVLASGKSATHRLHALQLAGEAATLESRDARLAAALRTRIDAIATLPPPPLPAGLTATLRPYQLEGFHFLAHLSAQGFGGVLADDMGLGKTVQTLAWLLHLAGAADASAPFRSLVVCPKSVTHGWLAESARFSPSLTIAAFTPDLTEAWATAPSTQLLIANYTQLRLHAAWFRATAWNAVVLDEGQFIKNPSSQMAAAARALPARHRLVLTGTPVENRLTDLWSLFAFAQPGLLGAQAAFRRQYDEKDPAALARLHRRVRHFLLRRTKAQAAPDLPPRTEDDLIVELEPGQRKLYDAELKRARAQLLGIETTRALDRVRFNILASLLRLRQICCHPALVDPAHAGLPSAKLVALLERLEELQEEGHQVLVFSQFVQMLEIIRGHLVTAGIGHLMLTGQTENRAELVESFQSDRTKTVFLLSLKAAGFGLNLTAASYVILYDPWWNPAVEAQAIDRTHRIGQTRPVIAYRLLAEHSVEEKIRALQQEKAALAAAVVQEESLASVLDLDSLRRILA